MTTVEVLRKAAAVVRNGWTTHTRRDGMGRHCALGAIDVVVIGEQKEGDFYVFSEGFMGLRPIQPGVDAIAALAALLPDIDFPAGCDRVMRDSHKVAAWNNVGNTAENVAATMEYAALLAEEAAKAGAAAEEGVAK